MNFLDDISNKFNELETQLKKRCKRIEDRLTRLNRRIEKLEGK